MLVEETQDSLALFPIYSKNLDVSRVGYFYEKDRVLILVYVKFLFDSNRKHVVVSSQDSLSVPNVQNVCVVLVLCILFYSSLVIQSL
jgi:hypothetical protein